jgi:molybdenum cofactor biosynthesis enzyme MoaA
VQSEYLVAVITGVMDSCNQNICCCHHRSHGLVQSEYLSLSSQESWTCAIRISVAVITGVMDSCNQNICHCHHSSHGLMQSEYLSLSSQESWTRAIRISVSHHRSH